MLKVYTIDIDPVNAYFWLFAGMLARLVAIETGGKVVCANVGIG